MHRYILKICLIFLSPLLSGHALTAQTNESQSGKASISVKGEVYNDLSLSMADLKSMPTFAIPEVPVIPERVRDGKDEELVSQTTFRGILLRDLLFKAVIKHEKKWEPGVYVEVRNREGRKAVFSFGEIFYSSIGRSILIAYERDSQPCPLTLVVATDIHDGRMMADVSNITVSRVNVELFAYEDRVNEVVRPPSAEFVLVDKASKKQRIIKSADLASLPSTHVPAAVLIGDCEGFHGIHSLDGVPLAALLKTFLTIPDPAPYDRYVLISSDDGYCATYSFGELFNSRLGNQVVIATIKDGKPLPPTDGFAMSVTGEDSTGGRSVKRINRVEVY